MKNAINKPSNWFWAIGVVALLWNLIGVFAFIVDMSMSAKDIDALDEANRYLYTHRTNLIKVAYALAVFSGAFGSIALLLRKKVATSLFILSFIAVCVQVAGTFLGTDIISFVGIDKLVLPIIILIIGVLLVYFARFSTKKRWLV